MSKTACHCCGEKATNVHHRLPRRNGGIYEAGNLVDVCQPRNVRIHQEDWTELGRIGGRMSARMRRMCAGGESAFCRQMQRLALRRWQPAGSEFISPENVGTAL